MADIAKTGAGKAGTAQAGVTTMTAAQRAYEAKRAAKAGKSLEAWLAEKQKRQAEVERPAAAKPAVKKPGFFGRLLDRAHKPL